MTSAGTRYSIVPPFINERLARSNNPLVRERAIAALRMTDVAQAIRATISPIRQTAFTAFSPPPLRKLREVYDCSHTDQLPGQLRRRESEPAHADVAVNQAYDNLGEVFEFYHQVLGRNSLDDLGMRLLCSVHVAEVDFDGAYAPMNNAFWNGTQMAFGDGDGIIFQGFTRALDVVAHELTHGVQSFTSNLFYYGQSGALNEHLSDVFGVLVQQWKLGQAANAADWLIGKDVLVPAETRRALRDMKNPGAAFQNDPDLGSDPQPASFGNLYTGAMDRGGVHINSGIPNRAFVLAAEAIGGNAWEKAGKIWYEAMLNIPAQCSFADFKKATLNAAANRHGRGSAEETAVGNGWTAVGL